MIRSAVSKFVWVGRATVFLVGLAVVLALVLGLASAAFGADGRPFVLGKENLASSLSTLVKQGPGAALSLVLAMWVYWDTARPRQGLLLRRRIG